MVCTHSLVESSHKQRTLSLQFMILEKLSNKVNPKKNIYRFSWKLEADKIARQKLGEWGWECGGKGRGKERGEKEMLGETLGEWDG